MVPRKTPATPMNFAKMMEAIRLIAAKANETQASSINLPAAPFIVIIGMRKPVKKLLATIMATVSVPKVYSSLSQISPMNGLNRHIKHTASKL